MNSPQAVVAAGDEISLHQITAARHPQAMGSIDALAENDVVLHGIEISATDVDAAAGGDDGIVPDDVVIRLQRDRLGAFAVGVVEEVSLDREVGAIVVAFLEFS